MGGLVRNITGKPSAGEKPRESKYGNPYTEELMVRVLGAIDRYNERRGGIKQYVPEEQHPYEWRDAEQRADIRAREEEVATESGRPPRRLAINEPEMVEESKGSKEMVEEKQEEAQEEFEQPRSMWDPPMAEQRRRQLNGMLKRSDYRPSFTRQRGKDRDDSGSSYG